MEEAMRSPGTSHATAAVDDLGPANLDVDRRIAIAALARGDEIAVADSHRSISWRDLDENIGKIANALIGRGINSGDKVAFLGANSVTQLELMLGCLRAGICLVPLSMLASSTVLASMVADSGARLLFVSEGYAADMLLHHSVAGLNPEDIILMNDQTTDQLTQDFQMILGLPQPPLNQAFNLIYSSGTTGIPKGIIQSRQYRALESEKVIKLCGLGHGSRTLISTPLSSNTTLFLLFAVLAAGGSVTLMEKFDVGRWLQLAKDIQATDVVLVPVQYTRLLDHPEFGSYDLSSFRNKLCTSAPLSVQTKMEILRRWPAGGLIEFYGMSEGGVTCTLVAHENLDKLNTVGQPSAECDLRIIDEAGRLLPQGQAGEIVGWSPTIMSGYHNQDATTFKASWFDEGGRRFQRSGDIGWLDAEGFLHLKERQKDVIISGGVNLYAIDLEGVLEQHPSVAETAVVAAPSRQWGETPVAYVVLRDGIDPETLRSWVNKRLGKAQRIAEIIRIDALPRNPIGKVMKRDLRDQLLEWSPKATKI